MTTPMERALKNLGDVTNVMAPLPISPGARQSLCSLLAAEIIADAIKEAAPSKEDTALMRKAATRVVTFETAGERARRQLQEALNSFDAIVQSQQESKQKLQKDELKPESTGTEQG